MPRHKQDFSKVDQSADPNSYVRTLDMASSLQQVQAVKRLTFELLEIHPGDHVLDVGCGTGEDVQALAQLAGRTGKVIGIDNSATMIAEAQKRAANLELPVEFRIGNVLQLDFPDHTFSGCRANRVLTHLTEPRQALMEMVRVARPQARIVCFDRDWDSLMINADDHRLTRKVTNFICDNYPNGWMGRQLPILFSECGLIDIQVVSDTLWLTDFAFAEKAMELRETATQLVEQGVTSKEEMAAWLQEQEERGRTGRFFAAVTGFAVSGRKS